MIPVLPTYSRIFDWKMGFLTFAWATPCMGMVRQLFSNSLFNIFWYHAYGRRLTPKKVMNKKLSKKCILRGLKLRGLMWNQISTLNIAYQNDQRDNIYTLGNFENKTPTKMTVTHAISKTKRNFQNRIPRELDKNFCIPRISFNFLIKKSAIEKSYVDS